MNTIPNREPDSMYEGHRVFNITGENPHTVMVTDIPCGCEVITYGKHTLEALHSASLEKIRNHIHID